jgi:hypothetical protein
MCVKNREITKTQKSRGLARLCGGAVKSPFSTTFSQILLQHSGEVLSLRLTGLSMVALLTLAYLNRASIAYTLSCTSISQPERPTRSSISLQSHQRLHPHDCRESHNPPSPPHSNFGPTLVMVKPTASNSLSRSRLPTPLAPGAQRPTTPFSLIFAQSPAALA